MNGDRSRRALARIETALARIEASSSRAGASSAAELDALNKRHARLRAAVQDGLAQLDSLIEGSQG